MQSYTHEEIHCLSRGGIRSPWSYSQPKQVTTFHSRLEVKRSRSVTAPFSGVSDSATCLVTIAFYFWTNMPRGKIFEARSIPMERSAGFSSVLLLQSILPSTSRVDHIEGRTGSSSSDLKRGPRPFPQEPGKSSSPTLCTWQGYVRFRHEHSVFR
jgi:hypothetical protein